jgi:hypothetical protein
MPPRYSNSATTSYPVSASLCHSLSSKHLMGRRGENGDEKDEDEGDEEEDPPA